ncbi:MAG TPA: CDP-alcohol phosphatidyltransferase family protein [Polyangiaceae bacterium]|nr:CDP-alcohol phosphatidyltransferase family protein [Polyangiaceae bacterium]
MALVAEYKASLKSIEVEEPIDLAVHRPLAFLLAKAARPTPITPNQLTLFSMVLGACSGLVMLTENRMAPLVGAGLLFTSQVVDCSDGMLARMRKSGSELGRMLDGIADSITLTFAVIGALSLLVRQMHGTPGQALGWIVLGIATVYTSSLHTSAYDHYKNLFLRMTVPDNHEGEDVEHAEARWDAARRGGMALVHRAVFPIYVGYLVSQRRLVAWFDPASLVELDALPPVTPARAAVYRRHMLPTMRIWRALFGVGSLVFGLALFIALGHIEVFLLFRLVALNAVFFGYLLPAQRRASREAFAELGVRPLDPTEGGRPRRADARG